MKLNERLNDLIAEARKSKQPTRVKVLQEILKTFSDYVHSGKGNELTEEVESKILLKMVNTYETAIKDFFKQNRLDLVESYTADLAVIKEFAPHIASDEEVASLTEEILTAYVSERGEGFVLSMKDMKPILILVQQTIPTANGKVVSEILRKHM